MSSRNLSEPITDSGIHNVNFFNGRLLTADDLSGVEQAGREHDRQLAKGLGEGVVHGLEVSLSQTSTPARPVVTVTGGLALCRSGNPVALSVPTVDVALVKAQAAFAPEAGLFAECAGPGAPDNLGKLGIYLFVASPASAYEGSVPMRHSVTNDRFDGCGRRFAVEGVKFRLERIDFSSLAGVSDSTRSLLNTLTTLTDDASVSKLRNVVAHLCFDSEEKTGARRDPFKRAAGDTTFVNYGALAALRASKQLSDCDVPLAVVYWSQSGVRFVDNWAARRLARRHLDLDVESVLRCYGFERLLQFERHLKDLFDALGALSAVQLQDYFAFVPPVGYFPVTGTNSPRGFSATNFFKQFTTLLTQPGDATAERFGALLRESFACPDVALSSKPLFELYRVRDNTAAVASGASTQLQLAFVSRALSGPLSRDGVARVLYDAWEAYRGIIRRRLFIMPFDGDDFLLANFGVVAAVNDVLFMSNREYALAAGRHLDDPEALKAFAEMHRVQDDFVQFLLKGIPFRDPSGERLKFARQLSKLLGAGGGGKKGLLAAVNADDLPAAVVAQDIINRFIVGWGGEGLSLGSVGVTWLSDSPGGQTIVPGQGPFEHRFQVTNGTDRGLVIGLSASVGAPPGAKLVDNWSESAEVKVKGSEAEFIQLAAGASQTVSVFVTPPPDAGIDSGVVLTLKAVANDLLKKTTQGSVNLEVGFRASTPTPHVVKIEKVTAPLLNDPRTATADTTYTWLADVRYTKSQSGPQTTEFRLVVGLTADVSEGWQVLIDKETVAAGTPGVFVREFELASGVTKQIPVSIKTPPRTRSSHAREAQFALKVESVSLVPSISDTDPTTYIIIVPASFF